MQDMTFFKLIIRLYFSLFKHFEAQQCYSLGPRPAMLSETAEAGLFSLRVDSARFIAFRGAAKCDKIKIICIFPLFFLKLCVQS